MVTCIERPKSSWGWKFNNWMIWLCSTKKWPIITTYQMIYFNMTKEKFKFNHNILLWPCVSKIYQVQLQSFFLFFIASNFTFRSGPDKNTCVWIKFLCIYGCVKYQNYLTIHLHWPVTMIPISLSSINHKS